MLRGSSDACRDSLTVLIGDLRIVAFFGKFVRAAHGNGQ